MMMWWVAVGTDGIIRGAQPRKLATVHETPITCAHVQVIVFVVTS